MCYCSFLPRIQQALEEKAGNYITTNDFIQQYNKAFPDQENRYGAMELGKLLRLVLPRTTESRVTVNKNGAKKREWAYSGVSFAQPNTSDNVDSNFDEFWENIPENIQAFDGWVLLHSVRPTCSGITPKENKFYEWVYARDGVKCGSSRIIQEIKVYHDLEYTLCIDGKQVPEYLVPVRLSKQKTDLKSHLMSLLSYCSSLRLCMGFEVSTIKQTFNLKGDVRGESREWFFASTACEWTKSIRHQATDCDMLLSTHSKAKKFCHKCAAIRHNSFYSALQEHDQGTSSSKNKFKESLI